MLKAILFLITTVFIFSGCSQREPKIIYVDAPVYAFQKINLDGAYIELKPEEKPVCYRPLIELNQIYKDVKTFYDQQVDDYIKSTKKDSK